MTPDIYKIQDRGQVVNNACQWLWKHHKLAFRLMVLPTLIAAVALGLNLAFIDNWLIYLLVALYAILILPVLPSLMFYVVEHPEESGYPEKMPRLKVILRPWWGYFFRMLIVGIVSAITMFLAMFTFVGGMLVSVLVPFAIVVGQRDEESVAGALLTSFKLAKDSFGNFCMVTLGSWIIGYSMSFAPLVMILGVTEILRSFLTKTVASSLNSLFHGDFFQSLAVFAMLLGMVFSVQIVTVVYHFFYGHCVEKESHPALIERMEQFDEN